MGFLKTVFLLFQGQGNIFMEKKKMRKDIQKQYNGAKSHGWKFRRNSLIEWKEMFTFYSNSKGFGARSRIPIIWK